MKQCSVDGCDRTDRLSRGLCRLHWKRWRRHGDPLKVIVPEPLEARFWAKVDKTASCWLWQARLDRHGYGRFRRGQEMALAHRVAYELLVAPIPVGLELDHLCRVRRCVNPAHLEPVTPEVNRMRGNCPTAINARKTHCKNGHEFTPENTSINKKGNRSCRTCMREWSRRSYRRRAQRSPRLLIADEPHTGKTVLHATDMAPGGIDLPGLHFDAQIPEEATRG